MAEEKSTLNGYEMTLKQRNYLMMQLSKLRDPIMKQGVINRITQFPVDKFEAGILIDGVLLRIGEEKVNKTFKELIS